MVLELKNEVNFTYEDFKKLMKAIEATEELNGKIYEAASEFNKKSMEECEFYFPDHLCDTIDLLAKILHDDTGWISYYVFDLEFGKDYTEGDVKDDDGNIIKLETIEDLWRILTDKG